MSRGARWLIALCVLVFVAVVGANLPASLVNRWLPSTVSVGSLSGTLWHGEALAVRAAGIDVERVEWHLHPLGLLAGRVSAQVEATQAADQLSADVILSGDRIEAHGVDANIDVATLAGRMLPAGWAGLARLKFDEIVFAGNWITSIRGTAESGTLTGPADVQPYLGSYHLQFDRDAVAKPDVVVGHFRDVSGPIDISGDVELYRARRAVVTGWVRARPTAAPQVVADIAKLPEIDPQGRRRFSIENNY